MPHVYMKLTFSWFANKEAINMNAKTTIIDFCINVPRAPVRRKTMRNVGCFVVGSCSERDGDETWTRHCFF